MAITLKIDMITRENNTESVEIQKVLVYDLSHLGNQTTAAREFSEKYCYLSTKQNKMATFPLKLDAELLHPFSNNQHSPYDPVVFYLSFEKIIYIINELITYQSF